MRRIAIIGGGIAGLTAAYELAQQARAGAPVEAVLFESSPRLGGIVDTVREGGFTVEAGPDAWLSAKPWARDLAIELGLESELIGSNDAARQTHIFLTTQQDPSGSLIPMPGGFHMMVPSDLAALERSPLFTPAAIAAYRAEPARAAELLASMPADDESVADFTLRHFGPEVLARVAAPLLGGIFGGDVRTLSVRAVMPAFVEMEREHGSLIVALQSRSRSITDNQQPAAHVFTTLRSGLGTLVDRLVAAIPAQWLRLNTTVTAIQSAPSKLDCLPSDSSNGSGSPAWTVLTNTSRHPGSDTFDAILLATPLDATRRLLAPLDASTTALLPEESSSAVLVAFAYDDASRISLPPGFGFLVPPAVARPEARALHAEPRVSAPSNLLLACTFTDQKFAHRVPPGARLIRAFFGGATADRLSRCNNDEIAAIARLELARILNTTLPLSAPAPTPAPVPALTVVRRWPRSLPQYAVGHPARIAELERRLAALPGLILLGNATHGVAIPDLIHQSRTAARALSQSIAGESEPSQHSESPAV